MSCAADSATTATATETSRQHVQDYYGRVLQASQDLKTSACCTVATPPPHIRDAIKRVHDEVSSKYYGCGLCIPEALKDATVMDLGCGAGRDVYVLAQLVGKNGQVAGVDMTAEQVAVARKYVDHHAEVFGYRNVAIHQGYLEYLEDLNLTPNFDVITSNCVVNLCYDKERVLSQAYKMLKQGGEMYFSDVYCDRRVPQELMKDPVLLGECLSGALYWNDFLRIAKKVGFLDPRLVESHPIEIRNPEIEAKIGFAKFYSATYRLFKLPALESACEDYGQSVRYKGTLVNNAHRLVLDNHHTFETGRMVTVCGNTYDMLHDTRFKEHFEFFGDRSRHFGIFPGCGTNIPFAESSAAGGCAPGACC